MSAQDQQNKIVPKSLTSYPDGLKPYLFHGLDLDWQEGTKQAQGDCPFCGRESRFSVEVSTSKFQCFKGSEKGNAGSFLEQLWTQSDEQTDDYQPFTRNRGLLYPDTLMRWEAARSIITGEWIVPGRSAGRKLCQLYRYVETPDRTLLLATPTFGHGLWGMGLYNKSKSMVYLCEGPWDAMALWEVLCRAKPAKSDERTDAELMATASLDNALIADANVLGVPGCNVFSAQWCKLFAGKIVNLMYDNDHPRKHPKTGKTVEPASLVGMRRVAGILSQAKQPPTEINYLRWGREGYDPNLPSGYDVRDALNAPYS